MKGANYSASLDNINLPQIPESYDVIFARNMHNCDGLTQKYKLHRELNFCMKINLLWEIGFLKRYNF